jgi:predicted amidohydrolase
MKRKILITIALFNLVALARAESPAPDGWQTVAPREEIRPAFSYEPRGGPNHAGCFVITQDQREGLDGWFQKTIPVTGGKYYAFHAVRKTFHVALPRRSALARVCWQDDAGQKVLADVSESQIKDLGHVPTAEAEYPADGKTGPQGWTEVSGVYRAPSKATRAVIEMHLAWAPKGRIEWSDVQFQESVAPPHRIVRLAAIHHKPSGKSPRENCEEYAPLIAEAARQKAGLVVLGETVPEMFVTQKASQIAEPIPGPTTAYFGKLARENNIHIVVSLDERVGNAIYNAGVLIGPDGQLIGKYRKMSLPPDEAAGGTAPGNDFPVFDTKLGKIGIMICYDGFFPEVARGLADHGAEIIAWPVWGCNPLLAQARACENRVFLVSSTYMEPKDGWMISGVFDRTGKPIAQASAWDTVAIAEVDLSQPYIGPYNLGDFHAMLPRHQPFTDR